jgi:uncharacterized protein (DUF697 family)
LATNLFQQIRKALTTLNPTEVREIAHRPARIVLHATTEQAFLEMERFFVPPDLSERRRAAVLGSLFRAGNPQAPVGPEVEIFEQGLMPSERGFPFYSYDPRDTVLEILDARPELDLALARNFAPFREPVVDRLIHKISSENGWFSVMTALPNMVPSAIMIPWAVGEFASDTAIITANQIRLLFLIAAASGAAVGYQEQKSQIASVIAAAFGWRAIARQAVGKIPMGGGIVPKAAIAYAGTWVVGRSFERFHRIGYGYTEIERKRAFQQAFERGKQVMAQFLRKQKDAPAPASAGSATSPPEYDEEVARQVVLRAKQ